MTRAAVYARISVNDPAVPKVEEQEARCRQLASEAGYDVVSVFLDDGVSAYRSLKDRAGWGELRQAVTDHAFDVLLFDRQDRLARDQFETLTFIADCGRGGIAWHSVDAGYSDLADPMSVFIAVFRGGEAETYSRKISENVSRRNASDRAKGEMRRAGVRPFGWLPDRRTLDPQESALVRQGIDAILSGTARWDVVKMFNASGMRTTRGQDHWMPSTVYDVLRRGLNAAVVEHKGETVGPGTWQPICTPDELEAVRAILAVPVVESAGKPPATLLSGIIRCECGEVMHAHGTNWARVYRCATHDKGFGKRGVGETHTAIKIELADDDVRLHVVMRYLVNPDESAAQDAEATELGSLYANLRDVREALAKLDRDYYKAGSRMTEARHDALEADLFEQEREVLATIADRARRSAHAAMLSEVRAKLFESDNPPLRADGAINANLLLDDLYARFDALNLDAKRRLIVGMFSAITVRPGRGVKRIDYA